MAQVAMDCMPKASPSTRVETDTFKYLHALYSRCGEGDIVFVTEYDSGAKKVAACFPVSEIGKAAEFVEKFKGTNLFLKINAMDHRATIRKRPYGIGGNDEVKAVVSIHLDVDAGKDDRYLTPDKMLEALAKMPLEPSMIVQTNGDEGGFHAYWLLDCPKYLETLEGGQEEISDQGEAERNQCQVVANSWLRKLREFAKPSLIDGTADLCRFLRPVGSKRKSGNTVRFYSFKPENRYSFEQFIIPESASVAPVSKTTSYPSMLSEDDRVITRYLKERNLYSVEAILQQQGYSKHSQKGKFWIRPGSTSGQPTGEIYFNNGQEGFTVKSGAADPLCNTNGSGSNGNWYSIESLFVSFHTGRDASHGRNPDAWQDAAAFCHDYFESQMPFADTSRIVGQAEAATRSATVTGADANSGSEKTQAIALPPPPPGFIADVVRYSLEVAKRRQPEFSLFGALALQAVLCCRKLRSDTGTRPNLAFCCLAGTGSGKQHAREINSKILSAAGAGELSIGNGFTHSTALYRSIEDTGAGLTQIDEFGRFLQGMRKASGTEFEIVTGLMQLLTSEGDALFRPKRYAHSERSIEICHPCVVLFGSTTIEQFFAAVGVDSLDDGFLGRLMLWKSDSLPELLWPECKDPPEHVVATAKWWFNLSHGSGNLRDIGRGKRAPVEQVAKTAPAAKDLLMDFARHCDEKSLTDDRNVVIWRRASEKAAKLALVYAASSNPENPEITAEAASWSIEFASVVASHTVSLFDEHLAESAFEANCNAMFRIVAASPGGTLSGMDLVRKARKWTSKERREIIEALVDQGRLIQEDTETKGRKGKSYRAAKRVQ